MLNSQKKFYFLFFIFVLFFSGCTTQKTPECTDKASLDEITQKISSDSNFSELAKLNKQGIGVYYDKQTEVSYDKETKERSCIAQITMTSKDSNPIVVKSPENINLFGSQVSYNFLADKLTYNLKYTINPKKENSNFTIKSFELNSPTSNKENINVKTILKNTNGKTETQTMKLEEYEKLIKVDNNSEEGLGAEDDMPNG